MTTYTFKLPLKDSVVSTKVLSTHLEVVIESPSGIDMDVEPLLGGYKCDLVIDSELHHVLYSYKTVEGDTVVFHGVRLAKE